MAKVDVRGIIDGLNDVSFNGYDITEVMVPQALMSMGMASVFPNSYGNITSIRCAPDVTSIGAGNLTGCGSLTKFQFSNSISSVDSAAFSGINGIDHVVYGTKRNLPVNARFANIAPSGTKVEWADGCTSTDNYCCYGSTSLTTAILPSTLKTIYGNTFEGCTSLESFDFTGLETVESSAFNGCTSIESIEFSSALRMLGANAFTGCTSISELDIGDIENWCKVSFGNEDSNPIKFCQYPKAGGTVVTAISMPHDVQKVSGYSFVKCLSLTSISLDATTSEIGDHAFDGCANLSAASAVNLEKIGQYAFSGCTAITSISSIIANVTSIGQYAFSGCTGITSVTIPRTCETIPANAFRDCIGLTSVTIEDGVTTIGDYAFGYCTNLTSITIPHSVTSISATAFAGTGISSVTTDDGMVTLMSGIVTDISASATAIDFTSLTVGGNPITVQGFQDGVFSGKTGITSLVLPPSMKTIPNRCFYNFSNLTSIELPQYLASIGEYAFHGCSSLTTITIPDTVKKIGDRAFYGTTSLVSVIISSTSELDTIGSYAFYGSGIRNTSNETGQTNNFILPDGIKIIGANSFQNCTSLLRWGIRDRSGSFSVDITVGNGAFKGCTSLNTVAFGNSVSYVGEGVFEGCTAMEYDTTTLAPLKIVDGWIVGQNGSSAEGISIPSTIKGIAQRALSGWTDLGGELTIAGGVNICSHAFENCSNMTRATIGERLEIPEGLFNGCSKMEYVSLPNGLKKIGANSFYETSSLKTVAFPSSLTEIGMNAFYSSGLTSVDVPSSVSGLYRTFGNCAGLVTAKVPSLGYELFQECTSLESVEITNVVTEIPWGCFNGCQQLEFSIPSTVTSIAGDAFFNCLSLNNVVIPSSCKSIGENAFTAAGNAWSEFRVTIEDGVEDFQGSYASRGVFRFCLSLKEIVFPASVRNIGERIFRACSSLKKVVFYGNAPSSSNPFAGSDSGYSVSDGQVDVYVQMGSTGWGVDIPGTWNRQNIRYLDT